MKSALALGVLVLVFVAYTAALEIVGEYVDDEGNTQTYNLAVGSDQSLVEELKVQAAQASMIPIQEIQLFKGDAQLLDANSLAFHGVNDGDTISITEVQA